MRPLWALESVPGLRPRLLPLQGLVEEEAEARGRARQEQRRGAWRPILPPWGRCGGRRWGTRRGKSYTAIRGPVVCARLRRKGRMDYKILSKQR